MVFPSKMKAETLWRIYFLISVSGSLIIFLLGSIGPIDDPDLWWHLKSGERIVTEGAIPSEDSFAFTSEFFSTAREKSILHGYPISQVVLFYAYQSGEFLGVMGLRLLLLFFIVLVLIKQTQAKQSTGTISALVFSLGMFAFFNAHTLDRPHIYSFLFFPILIGLMRPTGKESWLILPIMTLWANCHGGFIIGTLLLPIYVLGRFLDVGLGKELRHSILWSTGGALATVLNPNGWSFFIQIAGGKGSFSMSNILEYRSTYAAFLAGDQWVITVWILSLLALLSQLGQARRYWSETLLLGATCFLSLYMTRATGFFVLGMLPLLAGSLSKHFVRLNILARHIVSLATISSILFLATQQSQSFAAHRQQTFPENNKFYPHKATHFLQETSIKGRMFNEYDWGGFLIWKLYPQYQVFIDGRTLDDGLFFDSREIGRGSMTKNGGEYEYEVLLNKYNIEFTVIPLQQKNGTLYPLYARLLGNPLWALIYQDDRTIIFTRKYGLNKHLLRAHQIDKRASIQSLIKRLQQRATLEPVSQTDQIGYASALVFTNQLPEAHEVLESASKGASNNEALINLKNFIERTLRERREKEDLR